MKIKFCISFEYFYCVSGMEFVLSRAASPFATTNVRNVFPYTTATYATKPPKCVIIEDEGWTVDEFRSLARFYLPPPPGICIIFAIFQGWHTISFRTMLLAPLICNVASRTITLIEVFIMCDIPQKPFLFVRILRPQAAIVCLLWIVRQFGSSEIVVKFEIFFSQAVTVVVVVRRPKDQPTTQPAQHTMYSN